MDPELQHLASDGASLIVRSVATDAWPLVKSGIASLFKRTGSRPEAIDHRLDNTQQEAQNGASGQAQAISEAWRIRLYDLLTEFPDLAVELRALLSEAAAAAPIVATTNQHVTQHTNVSGQGQAYVTGIGDQTIHQSPRPERR